MNSRYFIPVISIIVIALLLAGCKKYIEIGAPVNQLATTTVFSSDNSAIAAQLAVYTQMDADQANLERNTGLSSDEIVTSATDVTSRDLYTNALNASKDASNILMWGPPYKYIYEENAILENVQSSTGMSDKIIRIAIGEARYMRAYWYFNLVNIYGDVPLVTTTDFKINSVMSRTPKNIVYQQILADLNSAQASLSADYLDASDTIITQDRIRPTSWAASAMLARVYLYTGNYDSAEIQSSLVINNTNLYSLPTDLNLVFQRASREAIWQIQPTNTSFATSEGVRFILNAKPGANINNSTTISTLLLNAFEPLDKRKSAWIGTFTSGTSSWLYPGKYKYRVAPGSTLEYSMILRLAEQYLIRAEARAVQNKLPGAISDLNMIRTRAGLPNYGGPVNDKDSIMAAILHERQVELFTEGHRWFDLKRLRIVDSVMTIVTPKKGGGSWNTNQQLYPIPLLDIQNNTNLTQNQGY